VVKCFTKSDVVAVLKQYLERPTWFYNVVFWLDLGVSLKRVDAIRVARNVEESFVRHADSYLVEEA